MRCKKYDPDNTKQLVQNMVLKQNPKLKTIFENQIKTWPLYYTSKILPSTNAKVFYIGDAFNGFLPTMAQGAGQSIESALIYLNLLKKDKIPKFKNCILKRLSKTKLLEVDQTSIILFFHLSSGFCKK